VIPVPNISKTVSCNEFRPINTLEVYEKVLELAVKKQIQKHCDTNDIIMVSQSGFREHHSCETTVVNICDIFKRELDKGNFVLSVFLDFRRAFETVNRTLLLQKLESVGIGGTVWKYLIYKYVCVSLLIITHIATKEIHVIYV